ncbi:MAG: TIGR04283 family arsenosugar biosynthesis glycosyltransferase [Desulfobacterales bacterium]
MPKGRSKTGQGSAGAKIFLPPAVSVIVPVLGESEIIGQAARHFLSATGGVNAEVIFVDGDPSGSSIKLVNSGNIRTLISPSGRGSQMNAGAEASAGRVLMFVHADTRLPEGAMEDALDVCRCPETAGGAFLLGIDSSKRGFRIIEAAANLRCRLTRIPYGDQAVFIKKSVFKTIGGYAEIPLMEDIEIMRRLKRKGLKIRLVKKAVYTSARRWKKDGLVYGTMRNNLLSCLYYAGVKPEALKKFYK